MTPPPPGEILIRSPGGGPSYDPAVEIMIAQEATPPTVAYRIWQVRNPDYGLRGIHPLCPAFWERRRERARCLARPTAGRSNRPDLYTPHDDTALPAMQCRCGLAGYYSAAAIDGHPPRIGGVITVAGRIILHDSWLRAETAQVEAFALQSPIDDTDRQVLERCAFEWKVPILPFDELAEFGAQTGREVPLKWRS